MQTFAFADRSGKRPSRSAEVELLLCCASPVRDFGKTQRIHRLLARDIDWESLTRTARRHDVLVPLYLALSSIGSTAIPPTVLAQLRAFFCGNAAYTVSLANELFEVLDRLHKSEIAAIPYKGPVLASAVYGNIFFRAHRDVDILVREDDFLAAKEALTSSGYRANRDLGWESSLLVPAGKIVIDLHQGIGPRTFPYRLDFTGLWQRLQPISFLGRTVMSLGWEDLFLILCAQVVKDAFSKEGVQLKKICDVAGLLVAHPSMNWQIVLERARESSTQRVFAFAMTLVTELLRVPLPDEINPVHQADWLVRKNARRVCEQLFLTDKSEGVLQHLIKWQMLWWPCPPVRMKNYWEVLLLFVRQLTIPNDFDRQACPLPKPLHWLYYLFRPVRLLLKAVSGSGPNGRHAK